MFQVPAKSAVVTFLSCAAAVTGDRERGSEREASSTCLAASVKHVSEVVHQLRREQVNGDGKRANERDGDGKDGFECHRKASVSTGG